MPDSPTATLPIATFDAGRAKCPSCGNVLLGRVFPRPDCTLVTCCNKRGRGVARHTCGARVALLPIGDGRCRVVRLTAPAFGALRDDGRPVEAVLAEHGYDLGRAA